jgi:hypothetical protein
VTIITSEPGHARPRYGKVPVLLGEYDATVTWKRSSREGAAEKGSVVKNSTTTAIAIVVGVAGAAVTTATGVPLPADLITKVLDAVIKDRSTELIKADTQALVQGPYNTGLEWLAKAKEAKNPEHRLTHIEKAADKFMDALGQEHDRFRRALIEYQLGICWTLLGVLKCQIGGCSDLPDRIEGARGWFERAHATALAHLRDKARPVHKAFHWLIPEGDNSLVEAGAAAGFKGGAAVGVAGSFFVLPVLGVTAGFGLGSVAGAALGAAAGKAIQEVAKVKTDYSYRQARKTFLQEDAPPVLDLMEDLEQLRTNVSALNLKFNEPSPTSHTVEEWLPQPKTVTLRVTGKNGVAFKGAVVWADISKAVNGMTPQVLFKHIVNTGFLAETDVYQAEIQKTNQNNDELRVEIVVDGELVEKQSTTASEGVVTVKWVAGAAARERRRQQIQ